MSNESPYLKNNRLADVIAALQAAGRYKFYKLDVPGWADRIVGDRTQSEYWRKVFEEHPEFFRLDSNRSRGSLVWRRQHQKRYDVDAGTSLSKEASVRLSEEQKKRISRDPLGTEELATLINTAVNLHSRAIEHDRARRWWVSPAVGIIGALSGLLGAIVGAIIAGSSG